MFMWCSFESVNRSEITGVAIFSYVHVNSNDENANKYDQGVQYLSSFVQ